MNNDRREKGERLRRNADGWRRPVDDEIKKLWLDLLQDNYVPPNPNVKQILVRQDGCMVNFYANAADMGTKCCATTFLSLRGTLEGFESNFLVISDCPNDQLDQNLPALRQRDANEQRVYRLTLETLLPECAEVAPQQHKLPDDIILSRYIERC